MLNRFINALKWPTGLLALAALPGLALGLVDVGRDVIAAPGALKLFGAGAGLYMAAWFFVFRTRLAGSLFSTFEHELTHAIFAWLTFHRVRGLKATWSGGGHMTFDGQGNWLIYVAPYFFPTLAVPIAVYLYLGAGSAPPWVDMLLGATVAYHMTSTWRETHWEQTDLKEVGFVFALLFLPAANLAFLGALLTFAHGGQAATTQFLESAFQISEGLWYGLIQS